eukprot:TRINITY_DN6910_c0_g1_i1.p1 TRINITY_DN6910_c0_g1~~TRINITY_DN6910_c0_g1_i1.p1  ORF type:complete len:125 (+),score=46.67 TRINITY_DN6910_c0_g1_i1:52-426(+)
MLSRALQEHSTEQQAARKRTAILKDEAVQASKEAAKAMVDTINADVAEVFATQRSIEAEVKRLQAALAKHNKLANSWSTSISKFNTALKEIGDVENWAERLEDDMRTVVDTLEIVHKGTVTAAQ